MDITVKLNKLRVSPHKVRPILHIIKGKPAQKAIEILRFTNKAACSDLRKLVQSGVAAANEHEMNESGLYVKNIKCDQAQVLKRHRFKAKGRVARIRKQSSHVTLVISDSREEKPLKPSGDAPKAAKKPSKEVKTKKEEKDSK